MGVLFSLLTLLTSLPAQALTIQPSSFFYDLQPGEEVSGTVEIRNESAVQMVYYPLLQDAISVDEEGTPHFFPEGVITETSLATWIDFAADEITLTAGESRNIEFTIHVPENATTGGYYGALLFSSSQDSVNGRLETRVGALIIVSVGAKTTNLEISEFTVEQKLHSHLPVTFVTRLKNAGTTPLQPTGTITISNMVGATSTVITLNNGGARVLPEVVRRVEDVWQREEVPGDAPEVMKEWKNLGFGYYTAWLVIENDGGNVVTARTSFWVIPWQLIIGGVLLLVLLAFLCRRRAS